VLPRIPEPHFVSGYRARGSPRFTQLRRWSRPHSTTTTSPGYPGHRHDALNLPTYERMGCDCLCHVSVDLVNKVRRNSAHQMTNCAANRRHKRKGTMTSLEYLRLFIRRLWRPCTFLQAMPHFRQDPQSPTFKKKLQMSEREEKSREFLQCRRRMSL
jgi:hypothetical protein